MTVTITLTAYGSNTGPFDLYSDVTGSFVLFESGVAKNDLITGYTTALVPDWTNTIQIRSTGVCTNYINVSVIPYTTTTSTSSTTTAPTTTTTTTLALTQYCYVGIYACGDGLHEIVGHEPFTGSLTYENEFGVEQVGYYCQDIGTVTIYSSSAPVAVAMSSQSCTTTTTSITP